MRLLHTEASPGWGGQERRILVEAKGMRERGHEVTFVIQKGGGLVHPAREAGFLVYELPFWKTRSPLLLFQLMKIIRKHRIELVNTHSSLDGWIGGIAGKLSGCRVVRTRHLSTAVREGLNSRLLYNWLADQVVTTCQETAEVISRQAHLGEKRCRSVPTGVDSSLTVADEAQVKAFRAELGVGPGEYLIGTLCVLRGWKGISDLLQCAKLLENEPHLKWVVVGSGVSESFFHEEHKRLGLDGRVFFAGHIEPPFTALAAMDLFLLLSWANEGVSQASLQAAWLERPLITTPTGGLKEVCIDQETGIIVPPRDPSAVALAVQELLADEKRRLEMGQKAKALVKRQFTLERMLDQMEQVYAAAGGK